MARMTSETQSSLGSANRSVGSDNHKKRLELARRVLREAGVQAQVRAVIHHTPNASTPAVMAHGRAANDTHAVYGAAWMGLVTGLKRITVFHPGEGNDKLHVLETPHPIAHVSDYLRRAGLPSYSTENTQTGGTRIYLTDPDNRMNVDALAGGLNASHSVINGRADRIGASADSADSTSTAASARAGLRDTIRKAEAAVN